MNLIQKTILIVDDEEMLRANIAESLRLYYAQVIEAKDGLEAYNYFCSTHIDLIITDVYMPNMDGIELCHRVRETNSTLPIIILSGYNDKYIKVKELPLIDYLVKPVSRRVFKGAIAKALEC